MAVSKRERPPMKVTPLPPKPPPLKDTQVLPRCGRMATDTYLRAAEFEIVSRPAVGEPLWRRRGHVSILKQSAALMLVRLENRRKDAVDQEYAT